MLEAAAKKHGVSVHFDHFDFASWDYYEKHGEMMPEDWKAKIGKHDAIYFGAVGWPRKSRITFLVGFVIKFRREFDQYVNLRPVRLMPGVPSPLREPQARRYRFLGGAREHRGRIFRPSAAACSRIPTANSSRSRR